MHEAPFFVVQGHYAYEDKELDIYCGLKRGEKKQFKKNKKRISFMSCSL